MSEPTFVSVQVASELSRVPETIILAAILAGTVRTHKRQGCLFVALEDVDRLLAGSGTVVERKGGRA